MAERAHSHQPGGRNVFAETLRGVLRGAGGACSAALVANDGVIVHQERPPGDLTPIAAHLTNLMKQSAEAAAECGLGNTEEMIQKTSTHSLLLFRVTPQYSLLLVLDLEGSVGKGRWELRKASEMIRTDLL